MYLKRLFYSFKGNFSSIRLKVLEEHQTVLLQHFIKADFQVCNRFYLINHKNSRHTPRWSCMRLREPENSAANKKINGYPITEEQHWSSWIISFNFCNRVIFLKERKLACL